MLKRISKNSVILALFAATTTGVVVAVNNSTTNIIKQQENRQQIQLMNQIMPPNMYDNNLLNECYLVTSPLLGNNSPHHLYLARKNGTPVAAIVEATTPNGYAGAIKLMVSADFFGNVLGVRVVTHHHETPGLGDKVELHLSDWITHFSGKSLRLDNEENWAIKKDSSIFNQFTDATITSKAIVNTVKNAVTFLKKGQITPEKILFCENTLYE